MKTYWIFEKQSAKGTLFKAEGFLAGRTYRGVPTRKTPNSDALRIMTRSPNARHPGEWPRGHDWNGLSILRDEEPEQECRAAEHTSRNSSCVCER